MFLRQASGGSCKWRLMTDVLAPHIVGCVDDDMPILDENLENTAFSAFFQHRHANSHRFCYFLCGHKGGYVLPMGAGIRCRSTRVVRIGSDTHCFSTAEQRGLQRRLSVGCATDSDVPTMQTAASDTTVRARTRWATAEPHASIAALTADNRVQRQKAQAAHVDKSRQPIDNVARPLGIEFPSALTMFATARCCSIEIHRWRPCDPPQTTYTVRHWYCAPPIPHESRRCEPRTYRSLPMSAPKSCYTNQIDPLLRVNEVLPLVGLKSRQGLRHWIAAGRFPEGLRVGTRGRVWRMSTVEAWRAGLSPFSEPPPKTPTG